MRKLIILALLLIVGIVPVLAKTPDELTKLAQYFPSDTAAFISMRIDDDFIATLDQMSQDLALKTMGSALTPENQLPYMLDLAAGRYVEGGDFDSVFRSWLGDTAVIVAPKIDLISAMNGHSSLVYVAVEVTDVDAAKEWLAVMTSKKFSFEEYSVFDEPDGSYYITDSLYAPKYLLKDGILVWTYGEGTEDGKAIDVLNMKFETSLADNPDFQKALSVLPEDDYNLVFYTDIAPVLEPMMAFAPAILGEDVEGIDFGDALSAMGAQVGGMSILDGKSLTFDFAQIMDADKMAEMGMSFGDTPAADLDFAKYIPADAALVMQDQNFAGDTQYLLGLVKGLSKLLDSQAQKMDRSAQEMFAVLPPSRILQFQLNAFKGMSGLSLDDFVGWMTGDYANYIRILPDDATMFALDSATIIKNNDADGAMATYAASKKFLDALSIPYSEDGNLLSLSIFNDFMQKNADITSDTLEMQLGFNDEVFAMGSQPAVEFALNPADDSLASDSSYQTASAYFLPDTQIVGYINFAPLTDIVNVLAEKKRDIGSVALLTSLFDSASLTVHYSKDGVGLVRAVLSLAD